MTNGTEWSLAFNTLPESRFGFSFNQVYYGICNDTIFCQEWVEGRKSHVFFHNFSRINGNWNNLPLFSYIGCILLHDSYVGLSVLRLATVRSIVMFLLARLSPKGCCC